MNPFILQHVTSPLFESVGVCFLALDTARLECVMAWKDAFFGVRMAS